MLHVGDQLFGPFGSSDKLKIAIWQQEANLIHHDATSNHTQDFATISILAFGVAFGGGVEE